MEDNDPFHDPLVMAAGKAAMVDEQYHDLVNAGFLDVQQFREKTGRNPTENDIFNLHLQARAQGVRGVRSDDELLDATAGRIEDRFGIRRRLRSEDANRKRAVEDRKRLSAASHGQTLEEYERQQLPSRMPNAPSYDGPVTRESIQRSTLSAFGDGVTDEAEAARMENRRNAIARIQQSRASTKMAPQVQINRGTESRFSDRRQATG